MIKNKIFPVLFSLLVFVSCNPSFRSASLQYSLYPVHTSGKQSSPVVYMLKPYSDSINKSMNDILGENAAMLEKKPGSSTLGYFMADAFLYMANKKFNTNVDAAFVNYGGIRLNELPPGKIMRGKLFELMPFDNLLLLIKLKGNILKQYLDSLAQDVAINQSGLTIRISNKKTGEIMVGGEPLDLNKEYVIANSDYVINNSSLLRSLPSQNIGYLQRDAILEYVQTLTQQGKKIIVEKTNRNTYAE